MRRRSFWNVRRLPSGKWQARYEHLGQFYAATFTYKTDSTAFLAGVETDIRRGFWVNPRAGKTTLTEYANTWIGHRPDLGPRTCQKYRGLLDRHKLPHLGSSSLGNLQPSAVRAWWAELASRYPSTAADAYRLLATICNAAVTDQVIARSPSREKGAGTYKPDRAAHGDCRRGECSHRSRPGPPAGGGGHGGVVPAPPERNH
jgi:hypothetical protein